MKSPEFYYLEVYKDALAVRDMSQAVASYYTLSGDTKKYVRSKSLRLQIAESLMIDSQLIAKNMKLASFTNSRSKRLRSANYINIMIRNILSYCNGLENDGVKEKEYLDLLRKEIRTFRISLRKWRRSLPRRDW